MSRKNGGILGKINDANNEITSGIWGLSELNLYRLSNTWLAYSRPIDFEFFMVGGGGAGGRGGSGYHGAGGGAGGVRSSLYSDPTITLRSGSFLTIEVGAGGTSQSINGSNSSIISSETTIVALGGGFGGVGSGGTPFIGNPGGSGGGGGGYDGPGDSAAGLGTTNQGYPGGYGRLRNGVPSIIAAGGGGGASEAGTPAVPTGGFAGKGGNGISISWVTPSYGTTGPNGERWFAGGGGGSGGGPGGDKGQPGGIGGGGRGDVAPSSPDFPAPVAGVVNTGGGGGGSNSTTPFSGGSGIVVLRHPTSIRNSALATTGTVEVENANGYITYVFTTSGTISLE